MSDETVAQARRARINALNEAIRWQEKLRTQIIPDQIDRNTAELERLLDHEKEMQRAARKGVIDPEEAGERTEAIEMSNMERIDSQAKMLRELRAEHNALQKTLVNRDQQIHRLLDTVASDEKAIADQEDEIERLRNIIDEQGGILDGRAAEIVSLRQVIDKDATQIALQEDSIESLQASVARQSETIRMQANMLQERAAEIGRVQERNRGLEEVIETINGMTS